MYDQDGERRAQEGRGSEAPAGARESVFDVCTKAGTCDPAGTDSCVRVCACVAAVGAAGNLVALLAEDSGSIGTAVGRQLLRTRRPFTATVFSPDGQVIFPLRRPFYLINSSIFIEVCGGGRGGWVESQPRV